MTDEKAVRAAYDDWHARVSATPALDTPWHNLVQAALVVERDLQGRTVLEIACGRGELAQWCDSLGPALLVAADFSLTAVRLARTRLTAISHIPCVSCRPMPNRSGCRPARSTR